MSNHSVKFPKSWSAVFE